MAEGAEVAEKFAALYSVLLYVAVKANYDLSLGGQRGLRGMRRPLSRGVVARGCRGR
jgi:hypothetical protein